MTNKRNIKFFSLLAFLAAVTFLFSGCLKNRPDNYSLNLEVWGVFDDSDAFYKINQQFEKTNPNVVRVNYKKVANNIKDYEKELTDAIAAGNGPDVFFFNNNWLSKHGNKISPLPDSTPQINAFKDNFVDVAYDDFAREGQIYAMPLYCDTLGLFYNKDIFNQAGITRPPRTWKEVVDYTKKLTKRDLDGNIVQSAIAMGRSKRPGGINRSSDILHLLLMQAGVDIYNKKANRVDFASNSKSRNVLDFYTQFAMAGSEAYTWNSEMDYSIDSFRYGRTAMMINYSYWKNDIRKSDPKLNFDTAPVPQQELDNKANFPNYWGLAVVKNKELQPVNSGNPVNHTNAQRIENAWKYIKYATMKPESTKNQTNLSFDPNKRYLENTKKPAARRDLIEEQKNDPYMADFATQSLTAESWAQPNNLGVETIFVEMIDNVVSGEQTSHEGLNSAESRINALIR